jgi:hypothetical protein
MTTAYLVSDAAFARHQDAVRNHESILALRRLNCASASDVRRAERRRGRTWRAYMEARVIDDTAAPISELLATGHA